PAVAGRRPSAFFLRSDSTQTSGEGRRMMPSSTHSLNLSALPVSDLSPLVGMKSVTILILDSMPVSDLTPLRGLEVEKLSIRGIPAKDLAPLKALPLRALWLDYRADRDEFLRSLKTLETINDKPAAEFWAEVDGKSGPSEPHTRRAVA